MSKPPQMFNYTVNTSGRNIVFAADGKTLACASSSSKRYKNHVRFMERADVDAFWKLPDSMVCLQRRIFAQGRPDVWKTSFRDFMPKI